MKSTYRLRSDLQSAEDPVYGAGGGTGGKAYNGAKMLLYQGIIAFELWTGCKVESWLADKVYERMQEAKKTEDGK